MVSKCICKREKEIAQPLTMALRYSLSRKKESPSSTCTNKLLNNPDKNFNELLKYGKFQHMEFIELKFERKKEWKFAETKLSVLRCAADSALTAGEETRKQPCSTQKLRIRAPTQKSKHQKATIFWCGIKFSNADWTK